MLYNCLLHVPGVLWCLYYFYRVYNIAKRIVLVMGSCSIGNGDRLTRSCITDPSHDLLYKSVGMQSWPVYTVYASSVYISEVVSKMCVSQSPLYSSLYCSASMVSLVLQSIPRAGGAWAQGQWRIGPAIQRLRSNSDAVRTLMFHSSAISASSCCILWFRDCFTVPSPNNSMSQRFRNY